MKLISLVSMKTLALVACLCVAVQSGGLRAGDDKGPGNNEAAESASPGSDVTSVVNSQQEDLINDHAVGELTDQSTGKNEAAESASPGSDVTSVLNSQQEDLINDHAIGELTDQSTDYFQPGEILVKFKAGVDKTNTLLAITTARFTVNETIVTAAMQDMGDNEGFAVIQTEINVQEAVQLMLATGLVEWAEPNYIYTHQAISNDPSVTNGNLWGMYSSIATGGGQANQYGIGATAAWNSGKTDCSSVYIGIIDTGIQIAHPDLAANIGKNTGEIPGNGKDDDNNGLIDDVYGWDFYNNDASVYDDGGDAHGTHVAGTIGAVGSNGVGVAGVCWSVKILSAKVFHQQKTTVPSILKAVDYFTNLKKKGINIVATNNSYGGPGASTPLKDAIDRANWEGILFVAAAGNRGSNNDKVPFYPSSYTTANIISVAAITSTGALPGWSNYGATTVDIGAPGSDILSTYPSNSYQLLSGTSMAAPHVTGAVALYKALYPSKSAAETKAAILAAATPTPSFTGKVLTGGRLNLIGLLPPSGWYPAWTSGKNECRDDGKQPEYMSKNPKWYLFPNRQACCTFHYSWDFATCMGTTLPPPPGWYPAWTSGKNECRADGKQPEYMSKNPKWYLFPNRQACCTFHYSWDFATCMGESGITDLGNSKWYMDWTRQAGGACVMNCPQGNVGCGGLAKSWDTLWKDKVECCKKMKWWDASCVTK